jgi:hypothetical protein
MMKRRNGHNVSDPFGQLCALACVLVLAAGCGGPANEYDSVVTGTVTIDGELAKSGTVTFHPVEDGKPAIGRIHPNGSYSLRTGQGDLEKVDGGTVVSGEYVVTVSIKGPSPENAELGDGGPPVPGPSLVAAKYASKETTDQRVTVKPGEQVIVLNVAGPEPTAPAEGTAESETSENGESDEANQPADPVNDGPIETTPTDPDPSAAPPEDKPVDEASSSSDANRTENTSQ